MIVRTAFDLLDSPARVAEPRRPPVRVGLVQERWRPDPDDHEAALQRVCGSPPARARNSSACRN